MPDQPSEKLKQAVETALAEARRLDLPLLVHILMMAQLELESGNNDAVQLDEPRELAAPSAGSTD